MCFAPHNSAHFFRHLNFQVLRSCGVLYILTGKRASRHNCVQLFISHLASWLRTRRFSEPTFRPSGATKQWKTQCFATFLPFRARWSFSPAFLIVFLLPLSSLTLPTSAFPSVYIVGSLTSKLPSTSSTAQGGGGSFKDRKPIGEVWFETHGWQSDLMDQTVAEALNLSVSLSASRLLSPLFIFLYQSAWFCLSVCPPLLRGSTFSFTWYFVYLFFYLGIRSSLNQFCCRLLICASAHICAHSSTNPSPKDLWQQIGTK